MKFLVTAGPTREYIDDVRYLSNASSGRMGCALVQAAKAAGAAVTFVCGPIDREHPPCDEVVRVTSAAEMRRAVVRRAPKADVVLMAAAVADYRPARRVRGKMKKAERGRVLRLVPTADILAELGRTRRAGQVLVGFALESRAARANALRKLRRKNLDLIVVNGPAAMGADRSTVRLLFPSGRSEVLANRSKREIARRIVDVVLGLRKQT